jgi:AraC-like DNA-binding protein
MLSDLRRAEFGIAAIAYDAGFGDLSYFNRGPSRFWDEEDFGMVRKWSE